MSSPEEPELSKSSLNGKPRCYSSMIAKFSMSARLLYVIRHPLLFLIVWQSYYEIENKSTRSPEYLRVVLYLGLYADAHQHF